MPNVITTLSPLHADSIEVRMKFYVMCPHCNELVEMSSDILEVATTIADPDPLVTVCAKCSSDKMTRDSSGYAVCAECGSSDFASARRSDVKRMQAK